MKQINNILSYLNIYILSIVNNFILRIYMNFSNSKDTNFLLLYYSVRKVSDLIFCENLVDFNVARLLEATLNLHTHA